MIKPGLGDYKKMQVIATTMAAGYNLSDSLKYSVEITQFQNLVLQKQKL